MESTISIIDIIAISQGLFLGAMFLYMKRNRLPNRILGTLFIVICLAFLGEYLMMNNYISSRWILVVFIIPTFFLHGSLIYLYTASMTGDMQRFVKKTVLHFVPYIVVQSTFLVLFTLYKTGIIRGEWHSEMYVLGYTTAATGISLEFIYTLVSWRLLFRYSQRIREYFSDIHRVSLRWLQVFLGIIFLISTIGVIVFQVRAFVGRYHDIMEVFRLLNHLLLVLVFFTSAFFMIHRPQIFSEERTSIFDAYSDRVMLSSDSSIKYAKHSLDGETKKQIREKLLRVMDEKKPFLEDSLTLKDLADELGVFAHHLSIVINSEFDRNFYNFINTYRIQYCMDLLKDPHKKDSNVLNLALESGFNSKTTFNTMFKKITGTTPTTYRKSLLFKK
ncbi:MAG TPA: helix-turn-helix transcriptional regulator [Spirochaetota bacterium]|nr:helix-turn-helix transcriptional regulator [Spirochaetota bacterium]HPJ39607.1 helix-turn-helix transcriptional regulator [Spirochaetota bacterium]HPQ52033.1 helix-turn-helix transcriptional regulator [Spirochaetota bacterium]